MFAALVFGVIRFIAYQDRKERNRREMERIEREMEEMLAPLRESREEIDRLRLEEEANSDGS